MERNIHGLAINILHGKYVKNDIKNLNGYSGQFPIGWVLNKADDVKNIHKYATDWIEGTNVSLKVYYYDMGTDTWHEYVPVK